MPSLSRSGSKQVASVGPIPQAEFTLGNRAAQNASKYVRHVNRAAQNAAKYVRHVTKPLSTPLLLDSPPQTPLAEAKGRTANFQSSAM
jgi:hypothetical protein